MKRNEFTSKFEELKKNYEGKEEKALTIDNLIQDLFKTKDSMFTSSYDLYNANYSYYVELENDEFENLTVDYDITAEGSNSLDSYIKINEIYLA